MSTKSQVLCTLSRFRFPFSASPAGALSTAKQPGCFVCSPVRFAAIFSCAFASPSASFSAAAAALSGSAVARLFHVAATLRFSAPCPCVSTPLFAAFASRFRPVAARRCAGLCCTRAAWPFAGVTLPGFCCRVAQLGLVGFGDAVRHVRIGVSAGLARWWERWAWDEGGVAATRQGSAKRGEVGSKSFLIRAYPPLPLAHPPGGSQAPRDRRSR